LRLVADVPDVPLHHDTRRDCRGSTVATGAPCEPLLMPLPPEIAAVRAAGLLLLRSNGHEAVGGRILEWVDGGCTGSRDFFRLKVNGRDWVKEVRKSRADDLLREAASLLNICDLDAMSSEMARLCKAYCEEQWPLVRGAESCPHEDGTFEALLWQSLHLWPRSPRSLRHDAMVALLSWREAPRSFPANSSSKKFSPLEPEARREASAPKANRTKR
jgi:hypothetical protein